MPKSTQASTQTKKPHAKIPIQKIKQGDLPLHCPTDAVALWSAHPKVYLPIEETGEEVCPYCGAHFVLLVD
jgi:uncharacterized Zn-finger protein